MGSNQSAQKVTVEISDSTEYDLIVFDTNFDPFLAAQLYPNSYYSNQYYRNWNNRYCIE